MVHSCPGCGLLLKALGDFRLGDLTISDRGWVFHWKGTRVHLTPNEAAIASTIAGAEGKTVSIAAIANLMSEETPDPASLAQVFISKIRRKFEAVDPSFAALLNNFGFGYRWDVPEVPRPLLVDDLKVIPAHPFPIIVWRDVELRDLNRQQTAFLFALAERRGEPVSLEELAIALDCRGKNRSVLVRQVACQVRKALGDVDPAASAVRWLKKAGYFWAGSNYQANPVPNAIRKMRLPSTHHGYRVAPEQFDAAIDSMRRGRFSAKALDRLIAPDLPRVRPTPADVLIERAKSAGMIEKDGARVWKPTGAFKKNA